MLEKTVPIVPGIGPVDLNHDELTLVKPFSALSDLEESKKASQSQKTMTDITILQAALRLPWDGEGGEETPVENSVSVERWKLPHLARPLVIVFN